MKALNVITLILIIIGGLNWGVVGLAKLDLVAALFGGQDSSIAKIVYVLVGLSALYQLIPLFTYMPSDRATPQAAEKIRLTSARQHLTGISARAPAASGRKETLT